MDTLGISGDQVDAAQGDTSTDDRLLMIESQLSDLTQED